MSIYSSSRKERRSSRQHLGHLKLSIIEDSSALVVQIFEARGLLRRDGGSLDTYVKIYILPDPHKKSKEKTKIVRQKDPIFNEKFSFILNENDNDRSLFISVWTHQTTSRNEVLGCMSFEIKDLVGPHQNINGWYQVLDQVKGRSENAQVPTSISKYEATISKYENALPRGHKVFGVTIMKSQSGYGFSVYGKNPIYITKIIPGLPAANADLRDGDIILELEGTDVRRANGPEVVEIVRGCQRSVHMVVQRAPPRSQVRLRSHTQKSQSSHYHNPFNSLTRNRSKSHMSVAMGEGGGGQLSSGNMGGGADNLQPPPMTRRNRYSASYSSQSVLMPEFHPNPYFVKTVGSPPLSSQPTGAPGGLPPQHYEGAFVTGGYGAGGYGAEGYGAPQGVLSQPAPMVYASQGIPGLQVATQFDNRNGKSRIGNLASDESGVYMGGTGISLMSYGTAEVKSSSSRRAVFRNNSTTSRSKEDGSSSVKPELIALSQPAEPAPEFIRAGGSMRAPQHLKPPTMKHQRAPSLTQYNEETLEMEVPTTGVSHFTRTASLSPYHFSSSAGYRGHGHGNSKMQQSGEMSSPSPEAEGGALSDTNESLPVDWDSLSEQEQKRQEIIHGLFTAEQDLVTILKVGVDSYYQPLKTILTAEAHHKIFQGIPEMLQYSSAVVDHLKLRQVAYTSSVATATNYINAITEVYASKLPSLVPNLQSYMKNFQVARQEIALSFTNEPFTKLVQESVEQKHLPSIYAFVEAGKEYLHKLSKAMIALLYHTPLSHKDQQQLSMIVDALLPLMADQEAVQKLEKDREVMRKKQVCIGFGPKMHSFPILVPGRFLIHEGEVTVIEKKKKKKIWMMLFSDILLLTRKNGRILTCVEQPLMMDSLIISDINCSDATEFQLVLVEGVTFSRLVRVSSVATREEWVELLRERASGSLAHKKRVGDKGRSYRLQDNLKKHSQVVPATLAVDTEPEVVSHNLITPIAESSSSITVTDKPAETEKMDFKNRFRRSVVKSKSRSTGAEASGVSKPSSAGAEASGSSGAAEPLRRGASKRRSL